MHRFLWPSAQCFLLSPGLSQRSNSSGNTDNHCWWYNLSDHPLHKSTGASNCFLGCHSWTANVGKCTLPSDSANSCSWTRVKQLYENPNVPYFRYRVYYITHSSCHLDVSQKIWPDKNVFHGRTGL